MAPTSPTRRSARARSTSPGRSSSAATSTCGGSCHGWGGGLKGLASLGRLILHDPRGVGLSSRNVALPNLETRTDDLRAVLDEVGSASAVIGGWFEGLAPGVLLAAGDPTRVRALAWWNPLPRTAWAPDYPWGEGPEDLARRMKDLNGWGTLRYGEAWANDLEQVSGGHRPSQEAIRWWARLTRNACTRDVAEALEQIWWQTDIRGVLPSVQAPALLMVGEGADNHAEAEHVASLMPDARIEVFAEQGWMGRDIDIDAVNRPRLDAIARFVGLQPRPVVPDTILSTVLFTDIVDSTDSSGAARRSRLEASDRAAQPPGQASALHLAGKGERHRRRRLLCHLRRAGPGDPLRFGHPRTCRRPRSRGAGRRAHRRVRAGGR